MCLNFVYSPRSRYHIINRYFDEFFPLAAQLGDEYRAGGGPTKNDTYIWMTQSWIVSLFLNCEDAHYNAWDGSGRNLLHCPNASGAHFLHFILKFPWIYGVL